MSEAEPIGKLDYHSPDSNKVRPPFGVGRFFLGLGLGTLASALIWFLGWGPLVNHGSGIALAVVPGTKLVIAVVLMLQRPWRSCGIGLLISIPIGGLIFLGSCAQNFRWH